MDNVVGLISTNYLTEDLDKLTDERTIASLPFGGLYRLIDFPLSNMVSAGITTVGVITPYKYRSIIDHLSAGKSWSLDRKSGGLFVLPGSVFGISSSDARFILRDIQRNTVFLMRSPAPYIIVTASNCIYNMDYNALYEQHIKTGADITLVYNESTEDDADLTSLKMVDGNRILGTAKGVTAGEAAFLDCFIINRDLLLNIIEWYSAINHLDLFDVLQDDYEKMDVRGYRFDGYAKNVFSVNSYFKHSMELLKADVRSEIFSPERPIITKAQDLVASQYYTGSEVKNSLIPAGCRIHGKVEGSVLFRDVLIEEGAHVKNSIIFQHCRVEKGAYIENAIIDRGNVIHAGNVLIGSVEEPIVVPKVDY